MMKYKIEYLPISDISLNPDNPRQITEAKFDKLVQSLDECPDLFNARPLLCVEKGNKLITLGGNMRLRAAQKLGYKKVPVIILERLTECQEREIAVKDNGSFGEWDMDMLSASWSDLPLIDWGVDLPKDWFPSEQDVGNSIEREPKEIECPECGAKFEI